MPHSNWTLDLGAEKAYKAGVFTVKVTAQKFYYVMYQDLTRKTIPFEVTDVLSGNLSVVQNVTARATEFVSSELPLNYTVELIKSDLAFLMQHAPYITTYWFINCQYIGPTLNFTFIDGPRQENEVIDVEALVVASSEKVRQPNSQKWDSH